MFHSNVIKIWSKYRTNVINFIPGSPIPLRLCPSCLRHFGSLKKRTHTWILGHVSCGFSQLSSILGSPRWYWHRMMPTMTTTAAAMTSQHPPCPTATSKQAHTGTKYPVQGMPPHSDMSTLAQDVWLGGRGTLNPALIRECARLCNGSNIITVTSVHAMYGNHGCGGLTPPR